MKESLYRDSRYNDMAVKLLKKSLYRGKPKRIERQRVDKEAYNTQHHFSASSCKAVDRNVEDYSITVMLLNSMFCLNCDCVLIISLYWGEILRSVR